MKSQIAGKYNKLSVKPRKDGILSHVMGILMHGLLVFLGGGVGSLARYACQLLLPVGNGWSLPTLSANFLSSLMLGFLAGSQSRYPVSANAWLLLATGFCGGFSTFSTLMLENWQALRFGKWAIAFLYTGCSLLLGHLAIAFGFFLGSRIIRTLG